MAARTESKRGDHRPHGGSWRRPSPPQGRLLGAAWLALSLLACRDGGAPPASTPRLAVEPSTSQVERFDGDLAAWRPVEGEWRLRGQGEQGVLAQTATDSRFPVALWQRGRYSDVDVTVRMRPLSGEVDASGGIVFRARDPKNFYVVRANALENNFRLYTVVDGQRTQIAGASVPAPRLGQWHSLRAVAVDDHIQAYLDGELLIDHRDATFHEGQIGLWTKADAITEFDDLELRAAPADAEPSTEARALSPADSPAPEPSSAGFAPGWQLEAKALAEAALGGVPAGWRAAVGRWGVEESEPGGERVFSQTAQNPNAVFNVALAQGPELADVQVSVRLRAVAGRVDQGGGVLWRARDERNYYVARYNPLEDNFRLYTVKEGRRRQLAGAAAKLDGRAWHTLTVTMRGDQIEGLLDGKKYFEARDGTFPASGTVGLWTKADAQTQFAGFAAEPLPGLGKGPSAGAPRQNVVAYTSVDQVFSEPIFEHCERAAALSVRGLFDTEETKSTGVLSRLLAEATHPQADVFWSGDPMRPFVLLERGLVQPYLSPMAAALPASLRAEDGSWTGFAARARVLLVNTELTAESDAPRSIEALAEPKWKGKAAIANPLFGTTTMHVAALATAWGEAKARAFLESLRENDVRIAASNGEVKRLVASGELAFGLTDTDDAHEALQSGAPVRVVYPDQQGLGTLVMPTVAVVMKGAPHPEAARSLVDCLLSGEVERQLARRAAHMPLRAGVATPEGVRSVASLHAMQVDYAEVARAMQRMQPWLRGWVGL